MCHFGYRNKLSNLKQKAWVDDYAKKMLSLKPLRDSNIYWLGNNALCLFHFIFKKKPTEVYKKRKDKIDIKYKLVHEYSFGAVFAAEHCITYRWH